MRVRRAVTLPLIVLALLTLLLVQAQHTIAVNVKSVSHTCYHVHYTFKISSTRPVTLRIPLPGNTTFQKVRVLDCKGDGTFNVSLREAQGTTIFEVNVSGTASFDVDMNVTVITPKSLWDALINVSYGELLSTMFNMSPDEYYDYTKPTYWWNYTDPEVKETIADALNEVSKLRNASIGLVLERIRYYVTSRYLKYEVQRGGRLGVRRALKLGEGDCSEYSDLFVTLARALGIPSRRALGFVAVKWEDGEGAYELLGHAWPEVYIPSIGWLPIEATVTMSLSSAKPGEFSSAYLTVYVEKSSPPIRSWNPLKGDLLFKPDETWFPGHSTSLKLGGGSVVIESNMSISHFPSVKALMTREGAEELGLLVLVPGLLALIAATYALWRDLNDTLRLLEEVTRI